MSGAQRQPTLSSLSYICFIMIYCQICVFSLPPARTQVYGLIKQKQKPLWHLVDALIVMKENLFKTFE